MLPATVHAGSSRRSAGAYGTVAAALEDYREVAAEAAGEAVATVHVAQPAHRRRGGAAAAALGQPVRPRRCTSTSSSTPTSDRRRPRRDRRRRHRRHRSPAGSTTPDGAGRLTPSDHGTTATDREDDREEAGTMTELSIRPEEIRDALQKYVADYKPAAASKEEVGTVAEAGDGIARVAGLPSAMANELLEFEDGTLGIALNLDTREIGVVILGDFDKIEEGQTRPPYRRDPLGARRRRLHGPRDRPARHPHRRPRRDRVRRAPRPGAPGSRRDGRASRCTSRSPPASRRSTR